MQLDTTSSGQLFFGGISITDWIQALGALVAVFAGIYAFISLFRRDEDREKQIESLTEVAKQTTMQTQQLSAQSGHMEESNRLFREQIEILKERLILQKNDQEQKEKEKEIDKRIRKNDIKPLFYQENGHGTNSYIKIELKNKGGQAKLIRVDMIEGANLVKIDERIFNNVISKGENTTLTFRSLDESRNANNFEFMFDLIFENNDGDKYSQRFSCRGISTKIGQPIEMS